MKKLKKIKCLVCGIETRWEENPFKPFCSERCSLVDLGKWADSKYVLKDKKTSDRNQDD